MPVNPCQPSLTLPKSAPLSPSVPRLPFLSIHGVYEMEELLACTSVWRVLWLVFLIRYISYHFPRVNLLS